ncbi:MAG: DeoR family transcriptional regulator, partial [Candidatus Nanohaloarchaea archaeon]|nr:DeoR family transcriptional regulator [Candidatus Nanohaloarchaea archaeon]
MKTDDYQGNPEARKELELEWLKQGRELDSQYVAEEFEISESSAREDLRDLHESLGLEKDTGENGRLVYSL